VSAVVAAGAGFLLAVLWFDLMFDVQVRRHPGAEVPEQVLASIVGYYGRVTAGARPMNRLVAIVMLTTLSAIAIQIAGGDGARWVGWASLALIGSACVLAGTRTVPLATRLGTGTAAPADQARMARTVLRHHLVCLVLVLSALILQLAAA
jgi:hypothetical protein